MHLLTILLLIIGVMVTMTAGAVAVSYLLGQLFYTQEAGYPVPLPSDDGARYSADAEWYASLPPWKQVLSAGWWWTNRVIWATKGYR